MKAKPVILAIVAVVVIAVAVDVVVKMRILRQGSEALWINSSSPPVKRVAAVLEEEAPVEPAPGAGAPDEASAPSWTLRGRVVARSTGAPASVAGAKTSCGPAIALTDPGGRFALKDVPGEMRLRLEVDARGHAIDAIELELRGKAPFERDLGDLVLEQEHALRIVVTDRKGRTIEDAAVTVTPTTPRPEGSLEAVDGWKEASRTARALGQGVYEVERLPPGSQTVTADAPGFAEDSTEVSTPREERVELRLLPSIRFTGRVVDGEGRGIPGATVRIESGNSSDLKASTDRDGRFVFEDFGMSTCNVSATADGFLELRRDEVDADLEEPDLLLLREGVIAGRVVDAGSGSPLEHVDVSLLAGEDVPFTSHAETDSSGAFELRKVPPGAHRVVVDLHTHISRIEGPFVVDEGSRIEGLVVELEEGLRQRGRVVEAGNGAPVPSGQLQVSLTDLPPAGEPIDRFVSLARDGTFELTGLARGEYRAAVKSSRHFESSFEARLPLEDGGEWLVELQRGDTIRGTVLSPEGNPIPGVSVQLDAPEKGPEGQDIPNEVRRVLTIASRTSTDRGGRYAFNNLPVFALYALVATREDAPEARVSGIACEPAGADVVVDLVFRHGASLTGRVLDAQGQGVARAYVDAESEESRTRWCVRGRARESKQTSTSENGSFKLHGLSAGKWILSAAADGLGMTQEGVAVAAEVSAEVTLRYTLATALEGWIVDAVGNPLDDADVQLDITGVTTSGSSREDGSFALAGEASGPGILVVKSVGFGDRAFLVQTPARGVHFALDRLGTISGALVADGRKVLPRGEASVFSADGEASKPLWLDSMNRFTAHVEPGEWQIEAKIPGFATRTMPVKVDPGATKDVTIRLMPGGRLEGRVMSAVLGEPTGNAAVVVLPIAGDGDAPPFLYRSDSDGSFAFEGLPLGPASLMVFDGDHKPFRLDSVRIEAGQTARVEVRLEAGRGLHGRVHAAQRGLDGVPVVARHVATGREARTVTSSGGVFEIPDLPPGEHEVRAGPGPGTRIAVEHIEVPADGSVETSFDLSGVTLEGNLTSRGKQLEGVEVTAEPALPNRYPVRGTTDPAGRFHLRLPGPGEYVLSFRGDDDRSIEQRLEVPAGATRASRDLELEE